MKIIWTELAVKKLEDYTDYIAIDKPTTAFNWAQSIQDSVNKLIEFPQIGRKVPEIKRTDIREIIEGNYRIIYRVDKKYISILMIRHSRQRLNKNDLYKRYKKF